MKKVYETPKFELKKFDILADILVGESVETSMPETGNNVDTLSAKEPFKINSFGSGFGW